MAKTKQIKVQYSSRCTYGGYYGSSRYTNYPKIQIEGKWLEALGFHIGDQLMVEYEEGSIKISLVPKPELVMMVAEPAAEYGKPRRKNRKKDTV